MMSLLKYLPQDYAVDFVGKRGLAFLFSGVLLVASLGSLAVQGLNFGIDFAGGILIEIQTPQTADVGQIRQQVSQLGLGDVAVTTFGDTGHDVVIRVEEQAGGDEAQVTALNMVKEALGEAVTYRRTEVVGPKVGAELIRDGALAVALSILAISVYIWLRFEWQFAVGAMAALVHDVVTTVGIFSLFQIPFDLTIVAGLLTIAGYSINDTVVQYDRVRENLRKYKKMDLADLLNLSLNEVLSRTLLTSITTLLAVLALLAFGGEVLRGFSFALTWGVMVGTFSSFYVALPLLLYFDLRRDDDEEAVPGAEKVPEQDPS
jgi:preprotein translocase subunit SecF